MAKAIQINDFTGMNNIKKAEGSLQEPRVILNADVTAQGRLEKRDGQTKTISLAGAHSLWAGNSGMLCVAGDKLYHLEQGTAQEICSISGPDSQMYYEEVNGLIYVSNQHWNGVIDPAPWTVSDWGIPLPEQPLLSTTSGSMPAGMYHVCFTAKDGDNISGNGPVAQIELTAEGGISISNRPAGGLVWVTDPNGSMFYLAGGVDEVTAPPGVEPLPSFLCSPPLCMENLCYAFGRMWGSREGTVYYSEPFHLDWFKNNLNRFDFEETVTMIARVKTGIFVGCENSTYFFGGTEPEKMEQARAGAGAVPGTLTYCNNVTELGDIISPQEKVHDSVPVWLSKEGVVIGNNAGRLFNLTQQKVRFAPGEKGASLYRQKGGQFQFLTSFKSGPEGSGFGISDSATCEVMRNGKVI